MVGIPIDYTENRLYDWCISRRRYLRELYLTGLLEVARYHYYIGAFNLGVKYARQALGVEPAFEPAHRLVMQCLIEDDQPDRAIYQYRLWRAEVADYEGGEPSEEIKLFYEQLLKKSERA
jgi:DNA-binding SARP family transcriptional activator